MSEYEYVEKYTEMNFFGKMGRTFELGQRVSWYIHHGTVREYKGTISELMDDGWACISIDPYITKSGKKSRKRDLCQRLCRLTILPEND